MVGAARRLATELVVIIASATQEIHWVAAGACSRGRDGGAAAEPSAGLSAALMMFPDSPKLACPSGAPVSDRVSRP